MKGECCIKTEGSLSFLIQIASGIVRSEALLLPIIIITMLSLPFLPDPALIAAPVLQLPLLPPDQLLSPEAVVALQQVLPLRLLPLFFPILL